MIFAEDGYCMKKMVIYSHTKKGGELNEKGQKSAEYCEENRNTCCPGRRERCVPMHFLSAHNAGCGKKDEEVLSDEFRGIN